jgi:hypothetical protein
MPKCKHQFVLIEQANRPMKLNLNRDEFGARVGCALCGDVRTIWPDGTINLEVTHGETSNSSN